MTGKQTDTKALTLISHHLCPYVQRAAIVLAEKGVAFERKYIDLANKPGWFHAISPLGKVPLLLVNREEGGEAAIFESAVICEYLEETQAGARLHPSDPLERARHRAWIEFGSSILADVWGLETALEEESYEAHRQTLAGMFVRLDAELSTVPYFAGQGFTMVDAVFGPIFRYFDVFDTITDTKIFSQIPKVQAWRMALTDRPSVASAVPTDYADRLRAFLAKRNAHLLKIAA